MSEMKHTTGPWRQGGVKELSPTGKCREIVADDGRIGLVYGTTDDDCKANAKAIAEVPDMIRVLQQLLPDWHKDVEDKSIHGGTIAGEITYKDVRDIKAILNRLES
jgi:hypothetical protein